MATPSERDHLIKDDDNKDSKTYSAGTGYAVMINYIIGTGVFSLPFAYYLAGVSLATLCILVFGAVSTICALWTLDFMARAEGVLTAQEGSRTGSYYDPDRASSVMAPLHRIGTRKLDFSLISNVFGGKPMELFTQVCMIFYCYGALWAYAAVFSQSLDTIFHQYILGRECDIYNHPDVSCTNGYYGSLLFFAVLVSVLAFMDVADQAGLQTMLTGYRFAAFFVIVLTSVIAMSYPNQVDPAHASKVAPYVSDASAGLKWDGFGKAFTFSAVALNVHYNMPDFIAPVRNSDKPKLPWMVLGGMATAVGFYIFIGIVCVLEFGAETRPLVSLNWQDYTGLGGGFLKPSDPTLRDWWSVVVKLFIISFPIFNMLSCYPLICVTLGDNMARLVPAGSTSMSPSRLKNVFRLVACLPPLVFAALAGKLDFIINITGLFAFFLELVIPCLLQILSIRYCVSRYGKGSEETPYTFAYISDIKVVYAVLAFSLLSFAYVILGPLL